MVAVHHEVAIPNLVELDRGQVLAPRGRRLLAACSLLTSSKGSNLFEACSLRIRAISARRRARRLARVKSTSTCSFRSMYGIIFPAFSKWVYEIWLRNESKSRVRGQGN